MAVLTDGQRTEHIELTGRNKHGSTYLILERGSVGWMIISHNGQVTLLSVCFTMQLLQTEMITGNMSTYLLVWVYVNFVTLVGQCLLSDDPTMYMYA